MTVPAADIPPQNIEAEQAVLGSLLVYEPALGRVVDEVKLKAEDFYLDRHRLIYATVERLYKRSKPVDELTVSASLYEAGETENAGGRDYISELAAKVPAAANAHHHAEIVQELAEQRIKQQIGRELTNGLAPAEAIERLAKLGTTSGTGATATPLSAIQREQVRFLWRDRIPEGMLTLLMGDPGLGKSLLTVEIAAEITRAGGSVLMLSAEDHPAATIRPRGEAAGANLDRLHVVAMKHEDGLEESLSLPDDAAELDRLIEETGARLVVIDPLMAHLPESVNSWRDQSMRQALGPLYRIASERGTSFLIVVHLNKATGATALYRAGGSIGIPAAVRSALLLARDPEDEDPERGTGRVVAHVKCNVGPQRESLTASISTEQLDDDAEAARLTITGTSETTVTDLLGSPVQDEQRTARDEAADWLREQLADGERSAGELKTEVNESGAFAWKTVQRARQDLNVEIRKAGFGGGWVWSLPEGESSRRGQTPHINAVPFDENAEKPLSKGTKGTEGDKATETLSPDPFDDAFTDSTPATAPPCRYADHRPSDWTGAGGKLICGVCSPKPGGGQ